MTDTLPSTLSSEEQVKIVGAEGALRWLSEGWRIFTSDAGIWIGMTVVLVVIHVLLAIVPIIGSLASAILTPVFSGGLMAACAAVKRGENLRFDMLFEGFRRNTGNLVTVGVIYLVAMLAIMVVMFFIGGGAIAGALIHGGGMGVGAGYAAGGALLALLVGLVLFLPLAMAVWFAPALVMLGNAAPAQAMKLSLVACWRNWLVFTVYGVLLLVAAVLASIPLGLGWLVLIPVMIGSIYASYLDIF